MRIGFVVNNLQTELAEFTTTRLAMAAVNLGHRSFTFGVGDFIYGADGTIHAYARSVHGKSYDSLHAFLGELRSEENEPQQICLDDLDVLLLRNDPSDDSSERPWAATAGILFGQLVAIRGVLVMNDPNSLALAINKTYFQQFPDQIRPDTCISRNVAEIKRFITEQGHKVILKPLQGSGGKNVFLVEEDEQANLNQMIDAVLRDGYCVAQEYLPGAAEGDVRLFVMNGRPLEHDGKFAAFRRVSQSGDARSNMHTGGQSVPVDVTDEMLRIVELVRPKLVRDGMFLVGLDILDHKLIEVNVFSPGGLGSSSHFTGVDFATLVVQDLERKVAYNRYYGSRMTNAELATL